MLQYCIKVLVTVGVVLAVSELGKKDTLWAGILASIPLTSLLAFVWLYLETGDPGRVSALSRNVAIFIVPSMALFAALPLLLRNGMNFWTSLLVACLSTAGVYILTAWVLGRSGLRL